MSTAGLPPLDAPSAEEKLSPAAAALRAPRSRPARYNGKVAALLAGAAAFVVAGAIFAPALLAGHKPKAHGQASAAAAPAAPPIDAISYGAGPTEQASGAAGVDCSQYPGMPGCAAKAVAAAAAPQAAGPAGGPTSLGDGAAGPTTAAPSAPPAPAEPARGASPAPAAEPAGGGIFFEGAAAGRASAAAAAPAGPAAVAAQPPALLSAPALALPAAREAAQPSEVPAQNGQGEKAAFVRTTASQDYVEARLEKPRSPYEVKAGTVIPAALLTAINSDLPGEVIAQVTQPVFDHVSGRYVLIPQGARIIGRYDAQVVYGQTRALVVWHRMIFPNGDSLNFGNMAAADPSGAAGLSDRVNDHFGQLAKGIVLSTLLSMGVSSAQDAQARSSGTLVLNSGASGVANEAASVGSRIANRDLNRQPTLQIRQGAQVRVLVDKDMILEPYN
jgi:type IV secretion system protein VirB10